MNVRTAGRPRVQQRKIHTEPRAYGHVEPSTIKKQHRNALRASKVTPFVLYSIRHTFLTRLGESGCDTWTLARIAGHSSITMSARYVHPSEYAVLGALARLDGLKNNDAVGSAERAAQAVPRQLAATQSATVADSLDGQVS